MTEPEPVWVDLFLGEVQVGDSVRAKAGQVAGSSRYVDMTGTVVGVRSGSVAVRTGQDTVLFWPSMLERLVRPS